MPTSSPQTAGNPYRRELAGLSEVPRLLARTPSLLRAPRGSGRPVVVLPGHGFGDATTIPLRGFLRSLGYDVHGWGLGANRAQASTYVGPLVERLERLAAAADRPVALVGQSLGGYVARETARRRPDLVSQVITLGTPIYAPTSSDPLVRPVVALYSEIDQVVPTSRSIARDDATTNIEIHSAHFSMGIDPDVWRLVATHLAAPVELDG